MQTVPQIPKLVPSKDTAFKNRRRLLPLILTITSKFGKWRSRISMDTFNAIEIAMTGYTKWVVQGPQLADTMSTAAMTIASSIMAKLKEHDQANEFMDGPCSMEIECIMGQAACNIGSTTWPDYREYTNLDLGQYIESKLVFIGKIYNN